MSTIHRFTGLLATLLLAAIATSVSAGQHVQGAARRVGVTVGPDAACGSFPAVIRAAQTFDGADDLGAFRIVVSLCLEGATGEVFDVSGTATYGDDSQIHYVFEDFTEVLDPESCVRSPDPSRVKAEVTGGTGRFEGVQGTLRLQYWNPATCAGITADRMMVTSDQHLEWPRRVGR